MLTDNLFSGNAAGGVAAFGTATITVDRNTVTHNDEGLVVGLDATIRSRGNNTVRDNATNVSVSGTLSVVGGT